MVAPAKGNSQPLAERCPDKGRPDKRCAHMNSSQTNVASPPRGRASKTTQLILEAAVRCYQRLGVDGTAMVDIASEAGIGRTTLYRHFRNRAFAKPIIGA